MPCEWILNPELVAFLFPIVFLLNDEWNTMMSPMQWHWRCSGAPNYHYVDAVVQDCNIFIANAMEELQSCIKPLMFYLDVCLMRTEVVILTLLRVAHGHDVLGWILMCYLLSFISLLIAWRTCRLLVLNNVHSFILCITSDIARSSPISSYHAASQASSSVSCSCAHLKYQPRLYQGPVSI